MNRLIIIVLLSLVYVGSFAQVEKGFVRKGNRDYKQQKYQDAEVNYRKALGGNPNSGLATYNLGNSLYKQNKVDEAIEEYKKAIDGGLPANELAMNYHNLGNALLISKKISESIEAYKKALRLNPKDFDTKYNLAFAQNLLKNHPEQDKKDNNSDPEKPSEYAQMLKKQADELIEQRKYKDAYNLLIEGMKKDKTVSTFKGYIENLSDVVKMNQ